VPCMQKGDNGAKGTHRLQSEGWVRDGGKGEERRVKRILNDTRWENCVRLARRWREGGA
jgi:hypothetical protein